MIALIGNSMRWVAFEEVMSEQEFKDELRRVIYFILRRHGEESRSAWVKARVEVDSTSDLLTRIYIHFRKLGDVPQSAYCKASLITEARKFEESV